MKYIQCIVNLKHSSYFEGTKKWQRNLCSNIFFAFFLVFLFSLVNSIAEKIFKMFFLLSKAIFHLLLEGSCHNFVFLFSFFTFLNFYPFFQIFKFFKTFFYFFLFISFLIIQCFFNFFPNFHLFSFFFLIHIFFFIFQFFLFFSPAIKNTPPPFHFPSNFPTNIFQTFKFP